MASFKPIYDALEKIGISKGVVKGKGSRKWKAGFKQILEDNNITSEEDISALRQHIEDKFSVARSGGTHDDGRFAGVMSYEGLGGSIWDRGKEEKALHESAMKNYAENRAAADESAARVEAANQQAATEKQYEEQQALIREHVQAKEEEEKRRTREIAKKAIEDVRQESPPDFMGGGLSRVTKGEAAIQAYSEETTQRLYNTSSGQKLLNEHGINEQTLQAETDRLYEIRDEPKKHAKDLETGKAAIDKAAEDNPELFENGGMDIFMNTATNDEGIATGISKDKILESVRNNTEKSIFATKGAYEHSANSILEDHQNSINNIMADHSLTSEQRAKALVEANMTTRRRMNQGLTFTDYVIGNNVHTGAIGAAALAATYGVAFGGTKTNAELYGSPF